MKRLFTKIEETGLIERHIGLAPSRQRAQFSPNMVGLLQASICTKSETEAKAIAQCLYEGANNGFIDGKALSEKLFHLYNRKVFISHSHHENFNHACWLAIILGMNNCFIDGLLWRDVYLALDEIMKGQTQSLDGVRRLYSSMFLMLGTAIAEAMQRAETIIYIQPTLISPAGSGWEPMLESPWIYWEQKIGCILHEENKTAGMEKQASVLDENFSQIPRVLFPDCSEFCSSLNDAGLNDLKNKYNPQKGKPLKDILDILNHLN